MKRVLKFPLELTDEVQKIQMPMDCKVVHVHEQHGAPTMWAAEAREDDVAIPRRFQLITTGLSAIPKGEYLGTVHIGWTVWHIYEVHS